MEFDTGESNLASIFKHIESVRADITQKLSNSAIQLAELNITVRALKDALDKDVNLLRSESTQTRIENRALESRIGRLERVILVMAIPALGGGLSGLDRLLALLK